MGRFAYRSAGRNETEEELVFGRLGGEKKALCDELFECGTDRNRFATQGDSSAIGLIGFRLFKLGGDFGQASFEGENSFFEVSDLGSVLFLELAFGLAGFGFGSFLLFAFARGRNFVWGGGRGRGEWGDGLGVGELFTGSQGRPFRGGTGFVEVVLIVAGVRGEVTGTDVENGGGHGADEVNIVADKDEGAFILAKRGDEGVDRADVQVGGRFVHEEEIGWIEQKFDQG